MNPWDYVLVGGALVLICGAIHLGADWWLRRVEPTLRVMSSAESQLREAQREFREADEEFRRRAEAVGLELGDEFEEAVPRGVGSDDPVVLLERTIERVRAVKRISSYGALLFLCVMAYGNLKLLLR